MDAGRLTPRQKAACRPRSLRDAQQTAGQVSAGGSGGTDGRLTECFGPETSADSTSFTARLIHVLLHLPQTESRAVFLWNFRLKTAMKCGDPLWRRLEPLADVTLLCGRARNNSATAGGGG